MLRLSCRDNALSPLLPGLCQGRCRGMVQALEVRGILWAGGHASAKGGLEGDVILPKKRLLSSDFQAGGQAPDAIFAPHAVESDNKGLFIPACHDI